ncbi:restriction endonuclease subunit S [Lentilactobacillus buchneri]|uniref:restriction endonuclease subunit S n=1 Tax=Lentilactobacillus buchneri TaxID=1581 RepID=UPI001291F8E8|nr:restriction endonuclease subunit S [Lentilactobacillus buchneri]MQN23296.1 restriction endonuclease subunit S [Lentilactobacillus buchneri]
MKDNQAKYPQLRFKGFTDPWEERKLGEVSKYSNGGSYENDVVENGTYELITLKSVNMSGKLVSSGKFINRETKTLEKDTLVMILSEQAPGLLGMTAKIPENNRYVLNQRVAEIKPNTNIDSYFLSMSINRSQAYFSKRGAGTKVQNISKPNVENFEFYCPSEREQQKIGSFFKHLDDTIALHQRKLTKLKELKQGYLQKMFPKNGSKFPQLRFAGFADAWEQRKLGELGKIYTGNTPKTSDLDNWTDNKEGHIWITPTDIDKLIMSDSDRHLSEQGWSKARKIPENSVLITSIASIGKNTINAVPVAFNQQINAIVPEKNDSYFILSAMIKDTARFASVAGQTATAIINKTTFEKFQIATPSYEEQQKIGSFFKQLDNTITLHQRKLEKLQELKKGYLQKMFC